MQDFMVEKRKIKLTSVKRKKKHLPFCPHVRRKPEKDYHGVIEKHIQKYVIITLKKR